MTEAVGGGVRRPSPDPVGGWRRAKLCGVEARQLAVAERGEMPMWLNNIIGACCIIWALIQTRMVLVYNGILKSAVIPDYQTPPSALIHSAMEDAISFFIFGFLFFVFYGRKSSHVFYLHYY